MSDFLSGRGADARVGDFSRFDADALAQNLRQLLSEVDGVSWYETYGNAVDVAMARLCLLRRARAGVGASTESGDAAVRELLEQADPAAVAWLLTRAISYMDEQGFPDFVPGGRIED